LGLEISTRLANFNLPVGLLVRSFYHVDHPTFGPDWALRFQLLFLFPKWWTRQDPVSRNDSYSTHFVQLMARRRLAGIWVEWEKQRESQKSITSKPHPREERNIDAEKSLVIASYLKLIGQYRKSLINHPNPPASNLTKF